MKKYSKKIVMLCILMVLGYTVSTLIIFYITGNEPMELTRFFFGFVTIELWSLAGIKKREIKKDETESMALNEMFAQKNNEDLRGD